MQFGSFNKLSFENPAGGILHLIPSGLGMPRDPPGRGESLLEGRASGVALEHRLSADCKEE